MTIRSVRHFFEYALARFALAAIPRLPRGAVVALANFSGAAADFFSRHLHRVAMANLDIAFGTEKSCDEKLRIVRRSFQTFALMMLDLFWFAKDSAARTREWVVFAPGTELHFGHGPRIFITAHTGNWEVLGMAISERFAPLVSVAAPLENRKIDGLFIGLRKRTRQEILSKHGAVRGLLRTLKNGGNVALVLDQNTKPSAGGIFTDVFGLPAPVSSAAAALALRTGAEVYTGFCIPDEKGRYHVGALEHIAAPSATEDSTEAEAIFTRTIMENIETNLRKNPQHWVWMYKRWKYIAPGRTAADFPFYSKELSQRERAALANAARPG